MQEPITAGRRGEGGRTIAWQRWLDAYQCELVATDGAHRCSFAHAVEAAVVGVAAAEMR